MLWTEAAFSACLAWHLPDHHWQCNWRVAWTYSRVYAGKRRTLWATILAIFSHMTRDVSVFVKCDTIFKLFFFGNYHKFKLQSFARYCGNILKVWWEVLYALCWKFTSLSAVKKFWKSVKNWQNYRHEFGVLLFWDTVYNLCALNENGCEQHVDIGASSCSWDVAVGELVSAVFCDLR